MQEKRAAIPKPAGLWGAYVMGLAFAFGWTPCIGPVLAAILAVAASKETVAKGAGLLAVYSAGLGLPFLIAATAVEPAMAAMARGCIAFFITFLSSRVGGGMADRATGCRERLLLISCGI